MRTQITKAKLSCAALLVVAMASLGIVPAASAHTGLWARFNNCPSTNPSAKKCLQAVTTSGEVVIGKKTVPVVNPVTLQGAMTANVEGFRTMIAATNGQTLTPVAQPVPGGLAGIVNCKEISNFLVRLGCEAVFENGLTGLNATLELAGSASQIRVSEANLALEEGIALEMPVKVHLENPLLGSTCYIGSNGSPLLWKLTTGTTSPPAGTAPIKGFSGVGEFLEEETLLQINGAKLVENNWSAPKSSGCGGFGVELILDPIIDSQVGLPAAAGKNVASLTNTISLATTTSVNNH
ncbi:MAG TPA: hypothetical protein VJL81_05005 [Solirubrobacterales bacterium]|nr:hypothetical protein [Solirubrobacterales bacterium]